MPHSPRLHLKALVPGCVFEDPTMQELEAAFHPKTGVLNVLTPNAPYQGTGAVACPIYDSSDKLPSWARDALGQITPHMNRRELLDYIIVSTHAAANPEATCGDAPDFSPSPDSVEQFCMLRDGGGLRVFCPLGEFEVERYELTRTVFSRNTGILETDIMMSKRAVILGCGSVGSLVAVELARAGVGNFLLVDMDLVEYHNICRHRCGISDVGRRKPDAVGDLIRNINPEAVIETYYTEIQQAPRDLLRAWCVPGETVVIGCADNRDVDNYANDFSADYNVAFLSIGFWERAFAGEIFYWIPGQGHACYRCALGGGELSQRVEANHHIYTSQTDLAAVNFEPGIAVDIDFVTLIGVKLALDIFNRDDSRFTPRLLPHLTQYTLVCNTNNPAIGGDLAEIFSYPLQVTTSLKVHRGTNCAACGTNGEDELPH